MKLKDEIKFEDTYEVFTIRAMDKRYLICVRPYTIEESEKEQNDWIDNLFKEVNGLSIEESSYIERQYIEENGECPEPISKDTFCYTIVDLEEKTRSSDNFYCKFDYDDDKECLKALQELNNGEMELSRRNKVDLKIRI